MKIRPMLGEFELDGLEHVESLESRALVEHRVPGLAGNYFQDMGTIPNAILIIGSKHGDEARDTFLEGIRAIFNAGEPTTFVADINTATDLTDVVIEDLQVAELGGSPNSFRYLLRLRKYVPPPEPPATGSLDTGILGDALGAVGAMDVLDSLVSLPAIADPTVPLNGIMDGVKAATSSLAEAAAPLSQIFGIES
jgi:hypothetical protein